VSYVFENDLKKTLDNTTVRPDVVNVAFGYPGDGADMTVDDIMKGYSEAKTTFTKEDIAAVQKAGTRVFASVGGWKYLDKMAQALHSTTQGGWFHSFANKLADLVTEYKFDGIDIDMEFSGGNTSFVDKTAVMEFIFALHSAVPKGTNITYTIQTPIAMNDAILKAIKNKLDWINVMEYNSPSASESRPRDIQRYVDDLHIPASIS